MPRFEMQPLNYDPFSLWQKIDSGSGFFQIAVRSNYPPIPQKTRPWSLEVYNLPPVPGLMLGFVIQGSALTNKHKTGRLMGSTQIKQNQHRSILLALTQTKAPLP
jgi:hypothetical protein